jgi:hypothetical protein
MAILFNGVTSYVAPSTAVTRSVYHTCATATGLLLVRVALRGASLAPTGITVTYGGTALSLVSGTAATHSSSRAYSGIFALPNPTIGASLELKASWAQAANCVLTATNVSGCDSMPINGASATGSNTTPSCTAGGGTAGALVVDSLVVNSGRTLTPTGGSNAAYAQLTTSSGANDLAHRAASRSSNPSITLTWSLDSAANWAISLCVLNPSSAAANGKFFLFF